MIDFPKHEGVRTPISRLVHWIAVAIGATGIGNFDTRSTGGLEHTPDFFDKKDEVFSIEVLKHVLGNNSIACRIAKRQSTSKIANNIHNIERLRINTYRSFVLVRSTPEI